MTGLNGSHNYEVSVDILKAYGEVPIEVELLGKLTEDGRKLKEMLEKIDIMEEATDLLERASLIFTFLIGPAGTAIIVTLSHQEMIKGFIQSTKEVLERWYSVQPVSTGSKIVGK